MRRHEQIGRMITCQGASKIDYDDFRFPVLPRAYVIAREFCLEEVGRLIELGARCSDTPTNSHLLVGRAGARL